MPTREIDDLLTIAADPYARRRGDALHQLAHVTDPRVEAVLLRALSDPMLDSGARNGAVFAAGEQRLIRAWEPIERVLRTENPIDRTFAIMALSRIEPDRALPHARRLLTEDKDPSVRAIGALCLSDARDAGTIDLLIRALDDAESEVRQAAAESLGKIGDVRAYAPLLKKGGTWAVVRGVLKTDKAFLGAVRRAMRAIEEKHPELNL
ncbi:HEAT repeat domain-containing protein [Antribacter gilvus]|uniref:HEAT repeat domain-containing protein n=1 Tax=Antribacter gilvus TaxID=2304675 RepID=UPI0019805F35|nr:HEAT repeat domain-containing protein [Antribacter gilvus]